MTMDRRSAKDKNIYFFEKNTKSHSRHRPLQRSKNLCQFQGFPFFYVFRGRRLVVRCHQNPCGPIPDEIGSVISPTGLIFAFRDVKVKAVVKVDTGTGKFHRFFVEKNVW